MLTHNICQQCLIGIECIAHMSDVGVRHHNACILCAVSECKMWRTRCVSRMFGVSLPDCSVSLPLIGIISDTPHIRYICYRLQRISTYISEIYMLRVRYICYGWQRLSPLMNKSLWKAYVSHTRHMCGSYTLTLHLGVWHSTVRHHVSSVRHLASYLTLHTWYVYVYL